MIAWTDEQLSLFANKLEDYHRVFGIFWTMSSISFTNDAKYCPTAMVYLKGRPRMVINEPWWNTLTDRDQVFVLVHECLHAMLNHGIRNGRAEVPLASPMQVNQAQDITINEMAESLFGIPRTDLTGWEKYCWISTCFPGDPTVLPNETYVYYLARLARDNKDLPLMLLDMHGSEDDDGDGEEEDNPILDELFDALSEEELEAIKRVSKSPGGSLAGFLERKAVTKKLSIKKLIKGMRTAKSRMKPLDTFVTRGRRFTSMSDDMLLPNAHDSKRGHDKFNIALCLDVSGSVVHLRPMFYELRELFLKEKELLEVKSYVFADDIAEITQANQAYNVGGGNSPFQIIESMLTKPDKKTKQKPKYPDCVIVITDGHAGGVHPLHAKRWLWLLTDDGSTTAAIPSASRTVKIGDVVFD
jgi:hypothetical protein